MRPFTKYHGLGNDFVVVDCRSTGVDLDDAEVKRLCDRHFGIGADGVLSVLPSSDGAARMVVHNADASIAEMCGNGLRCVVKYLAESAGGRPASLGVQTGAGLLESEIAWGPKGVELVTVAMGPARLESPLLPNGGPFVRQMIDGLVGTAVSLGNPHLVLLDTPASEAATLGPKLELHPLYPQRTNVEFVTRRDDGGLDVTVWERGVGLTLACGTGACASVAASALAGRTPFDAWVPVRLPGGMLDIKVARDLSMVWLRGPATRVFEGTVA
ncbi:MAG: diaminopimelate epimerase [Archangium sp.]|nr:diaminopimelate epimerase [Archangium sp.]